MSTYCDRLCSFLGSNSLGCQMCRFGERFREVLLLLDGLEERIQVQNTLKDTSSLKEELEPAAASQSESNERKESIRLATLEIAGVLDSIESLSEQQRRIATVQINVLSNLISQECDSDARMTAYYTLQGILVSIIDNSIDSQ
jgi:hypothetical protein